MMCGRKHASCDQVSYWPLLVVSSPDLWSLDPCCSLHLSHTDVSLCTWQPQRQACTCHCLCGAAQVHSRVQLPAAERWWGGTVQGRLLHCQREVPGWLVQGSVPSHRCLGRLPGELCPRGQVGHHNVLFVQYIAWCHIKPDKQTGGRGGVFFWAVRSSEGLTQTRKPFWRRPDQHWTEVVGRKSFCFVLREAPNKQLDASLLSNLLQSLY